MSYTPSPKQALVLWNLLITGEEPMMSKVQPDLSPAERKSLRDAGLIRLERRGRAQHIVLEDKAWDWAVDNFDVELSLSKYAVPVLHALLLKLKDYTKTHSVSLAEILTARDAPSSPEDTGSARPHPSNDLASKALMEHVRQAYFRIAEGNAGFRVRLCELRAQLPDLSEQHKSQLFMAMQRQGQLALLAAEDLQSLNADDEAAAVDLGNGDKRYFAHIKP